MNPTNNQISLSEVPNIPIGKLSTLAPDQLLFLQKQAEENLQKAKMLKDWLDSSISSQLVTPPKSPFPNPVESIPQTSNLN